MEESNKTKFVDLYLKWNEQGQLKINLQVISMLIKSGLTEKQIAKYYHIPTDNLKDLKKKYFDFAYAFDKDNIEIMVQTFKTLITLSQGYTKKIPRKQSYKNRKGKEKATITETYVYQ